MDRHVPDRATCGYKQRFACELRQLYSGLCRRLGGCHHGHRNIRISLCASRKAICIKRLVQRSKPFFDSSLIQGYLNSCTMAASPAGSLFPIFCAQFSPRVLRTQKGVSNYFAASRAVVRA